MSVLTVLVAEMKAGQTQADLELHAAFLEFEIAYQRAVAYERKLARHAPCKCGCAWGIHQHYTSSTYCSHCGAAGCERYRNSRSFWRRLRWIFPQGEMPCPHPI